MPAETSRELIGLSFLSGALTMAEMIAKACSSPQTAEINAGRRAGTLMKWVHLGLIEGGVFVVIAAVISPQAAGAFLAGGALEGAVTYAEYRYALAAGLASDAPGTEDY